MTMKVRALIVLVFVASTMWLAGCGHYVCGTTFGASSCNAGNGGLNQGNGGTTKGTYLLIADAGGIQGEVLDPTAGTIKITPGFGQVTTPATNDNPGDWMVIAGGKFMYAGYSETGLIYGWTLNGDGTISSISGVSPRSAIPLITNTSSGTQTMVANPAGTLLFVLDQLNQQVDMYQIGTDGTLSSNPTIIQLTDFEPVNLAIDGLGRFLYISNLVGIETTQVAIYNITTATLNAPVAMTLQQMQGEASGTYMVGTRVDFATFDQNIHVMSINSSNGALTEVGTGFPTDDVPVQVAVQPNAGGTLVYSVDANGSVDGASLNLTSGTLTAVTGSPFSLEALSGEFDPAGKYFFVVEGTNIIHSNLFAYDVSASSDLTTSLASVGWAAGAWQPFDIQ